MKKLLTLSLLALVACEYPTIEIGQYDVEIGRRFAIERWGYNYLGERTYSGFTDTVNVYGTCLIGCYDLDSAEAMTLLPYRMGVDSNAIDTSFTFTYAVPK